MYADSVFRRADEVSISEYLLCRENKPTRTVDVRMTVDQEIYNAQTLRGDIVMEGIVASTYTSVYSEKIARLEKQSRNIYVRFSSLTCLCSCEQRMRNLQYAST